jgi:hypothetical protein
MFISSTYNNGRKRKGNSRPNFRAIRAMEQHTAKKRKEEGLKTLSRNFFNTNVYIPTELEPFKQYKIDREFQVEKTISKKEALSVQYAFLYVENRITKQYHFQPFIVRENTTYVDSDGIIRLKKEATNYNNKKLNKDIVKYGIDNFDVSLREVGTMPKLLDYVVQDLTMYEDNKSELRYNRHISLRKVYSSYFLNILMQDIQYAFKNKFNDMSRSINEHINLEDEDFTINLTPHKITNNEYAVKIQIGAMLSCALHINGKHDDKIILIVKEFHRINNHVIDSITSADKNVYDKNLVDFITSDVNCLDNVCSHTKRVINTILSEQRALLPEQVVTLDTIQPAINTFSKNIYVITDKTVGKVHFVPQTRFDVTEGDAVALYNYINSRYASNEMKRCFNRGDSFVVGVYNCRSKQEYNELAFKSPYAKTFKTMNVNNNDKLNEILLNKYNEYTQDIKNVYNNSSINHNHIEKHLNDVYSMVRSHIATNRNSSNDLNNNCGHQDNNNHSVDNLFAKGINPWGGINEVMLGNCNDQEFIESQVNLLFHNIVGVQHSFLMDIGANNIINKYSIYKIRVTKNVRQLTEAKGRPLNSPLMNTSEPVTKEQLSSQKVTNIDDATGSLDGFHKISTAVNKQGSHAPSKYIGNIVYLKKCLVNGEHPCKSEVKNGRSKSGKS